MTNEEVLGVLSDAVSLGETIPVRCSHSTPRGDCMTRSDFRSSLRSGIAAAGLTEEEAAAFLIDRLTFGSRPGDVERVAGIGIEIWAEEQLNAALPDSGVSERLKAFPASTMDAQEITRRYPDLGKLAAHARHNFDVIPPRDTPVDLDWRKRALNRFLREQGMLEQDPDLFGDMVAQKVVRAVYAENQLTEVLTDFWFNHFSVSFMNYRCRNWVLSFERDAIRPRVLGKFGDLLAATARHPAMLLYLDNAESVANEPSQTSMQLAFRKMRESGEPQEEIEARIARITEEIDKVEEEEEILLQKQYRPRAGINENYARELMELHTMGVDCGYAQEDIREVARTLTGWTVHPWGCTAEWFKTGFQDGREVGFFRDGPFLFRPDWHDSTEKRVLGRTITAGRGKDEGEAVLDLIATHPSAARFISRKLAVRFVSEEPPDALVDRLAAVFMESQGDIRKVMESIITLPVFWEQASRRAKVKSPFAFVASALRALDAEVTKTKELADWLSRMGQPLYCFMAPTGFPDRGSFWINSGTILNRMSFGLNLAMGKISGVHIPPATVDANAAPDVYLNRLLPNRKTERTITTLSDLLRNPAFLEDVDASPDEDSNFPRVNPPARIAGVVIGGPDFQCH